MGWEQPDLFRVVVKKNFSFGFSGKNCSNDFGCNGWGISIETLHICKEIVLLPELKTSDVKHMAIEEAQKLIDERKKTEGFKEI